MVGVLKESVRLRAWATLVSKGVQELYCLEGSMHGGCVINPLAKRRPQLNQQELLLYLDDK